VLSLPLTCDALRTANRLTAPAGTIGHVLAIWLNSAAGNLTATNRTNGRVRPRVCKNAISIRFRGYQNPSDLK
jgi:hypothetical protein